MFTVCPWPPGIGWENQWANQKESIESSAKIMFTRPLSSNLPTTIDEAVSILIADLPLIDRTRLGSMKTEQLHLVHKVVGLQIARDFRLWSGNDLLLHECLQAIEETGTGDDDPTMVIVHAMWKKLQETHVLRLIKS